MAVQKILPLLMGLCCIAVSEMIFSGIKYFSNIAISLLIFFTSFLVSVIFFVALYNFALPTIAFDEKFNNAYAMLKR